MRVVAEISRDAASARDLTTLLEKSAQLILDRFHFYHVGIFIKDNNNEYFSLTASPTQAGRKMLAEYYRVHVGEPGNLGRVAAIGEARMILDADREPLYIKNPLLPDTRSQLTLPVKINNKVIGILDIHSDQTNTFNPDDISIMQILADQLATAIERTRLMEGMEQNLSELERAYGQYTIEGWKRLAASGRLVNKGYRFNNIRIEPVREYPNWDNAGAASDHNIDSKNTFANKLIELPIKLRGQTVGVVHAKLKEGYGKNTISTLQLAIERLSSALESARLYEEASIRADREQAISQITSAISSSTEYESILQNTVREIGNVLSDSEVTIQILDELDR
jgi:putative methionine-R-sulfoxide reductase with GAF domain